MMIIRGLSFRKARQISSIPIISRNAVKVALSGMKKGNTSRLDGIQMEVWQGHSLSLSLHLSPSLSLSFSLSPSLSHALSISLPSLSLPSPSHSLSPSLTHALSPRVIVEYKPVMSRCYDKLRCHATVSWRRLFV